MPWLDIALVIIMLISGLLAMVRGFMREVLSIAAWALAAAAALFAALRLSTAAKEYFSNLPEQAVVAGVALAAFLLTLIVVSLITVRISDMVLDSRVGALDRTLGFLFGLGRGFLIVAVAYIFFDKLVVERSQPAAVRNAKSLVVLRAARDWLENTLPDDLEHTMSRWLKRPKPGDTDTPDSHPDQRGELEKPAGGRADAGYDRLSRASMQQLLEVKGNVH
jgi:membrane protein required for colicin V production